MSRDPSRTEDPTKKRVDKARDDGSVAKSDDLGKTVTLLVGLVGMYYLIGYVANELKGIYIWSFSEGMLIPATKLQIHNLLLFFSVKLAKMLLPLLILLALAAFVIMRIQVGHLWSPKVFEPKFGKMFNIMNGIKRLMLDPKAFIKLGKSMLQASVVGYSLYIVLNQEVDNLLPLFFATPEGVAVYILSLGFKMVLYALVPMIIISLADTWYVRWDYNENLKMTKDEVKDERKQAEGDPQVKGQQRKKMMEVMQRRMLQEVPKADVVITNPTHFAVALRYNPLEAPAPVVVAKGADHLAQKIKEIAREHNVAIRENKPLARALYDQVEIGDVIPEEMYKAVATILAQLNKIGRRQSDG